MATAPKNTAEDRYQMVVDLNETGGVKPPTYLDEDEQEQPMQYVSGRGVFFIMPDATQSFARNMKR